MKAIALLDHVVTRLAAIRTSNGYATDAGARVYRVILGMPIPEDLTLPALFLRLDSAGIQTTNKVKRADTVSTLALTIEGAVAVTVQSPPDTALLTLLNDIRTSLLNESAFTGLLYGIDPLQLSDASFRLPEGGATMATVIQPFTLSFAERYTL